MTEIEFLKILIRNSELRYVSYTSLLSVIHKEKHLYETWYIEWIRELKNSELIWLKTLQYERTICNI